MDVKVRKEDKLMKLPQYLQFIIENVNTPLILFYEHKKPYNL